MKQADKNGKIIYHKFGAKAVRWFRISQTEAELLLTNEQGEIVKNPIVLSRNKQLNLVPVPGSS